MALSPKPQLEFPHVDEGRLTAVLAWDALLVPILLGPKSRPRHGQGLWGRMGGSPAGSSGFMALGP